MAQIKLEIFADGPDDLRETLTKLLGETKLNVEWRQWNPPPVDENATLAGPAEVSGAKPAAPKPGKAKPAPKAETVAAPPAADEAPAGITATPEDRQPPATSDASYDDVKKALIELMDKKSASVVQGLLKEQFGVVAISQLDKARYGEALVKLTEWANG